MGLRRSIIILAAIAGGTFSCFAYSQPQHVEVYKGTDPINFDPEDKKTSTRILTTEPIMVNFPIVGPQVVGYAPKCVANAADADCKSAMRDYKAVQDAAKVLDEYHLGKDGTLRVIRMNAPHPTGYAAGLYSADDDAVVVYPPAGPSTIPHETAHAWFEEKVYSPGTCALPCSHAEIKRWGVNEGFAKIIGYQVTGSGHGVSPSADNTEDILAGNKCSDLATAAGAASCAHDLGNLVFKAYKKTVDSYGKDEATDVYKTALVRLAGQTITLASLHRTVRQVLVEREPTVWVIYPPPPDPDPFWLFDWLYALWAWGIPIEYGDH